ncbi:rCG53446 [Rattus norvegicus]|uniref:RCG53446 n=1 Tax=Rattus norvegicus TaxID=10116 RepID=A6JRG0_RAT|nr:rCG53446 [Rattus norvegicus]
MNSQSLRSRSWSSEQVDATNWIPGLPKPSLRTFPLQLTPSRLVFGDLSSALRKTGLCPTARTPISSFLCIRHFSGKGNVGRGMQFLKFFFKLIYFI